VAVDHVLPFVLMTREWQDGDLHQVWNLVLACYACNSARRHQTLARRHTAATEMIPSWKPPVITAAV
jgi:5-methylcytosine-specific restriction endonuclease McrA